MSFAPIPKTVPVNACETVSGRYVDVVDPNPTDIVITDIAWSLARQARFAGHTICDPVYCVAQHACFVEFILDYAMSSDAAPDILASRNEWLLKKTGNMNASYASSYARLPLILMHTLNHDDTEAYLVDLPSPVKRHPALREPYKALEHNLKIKIDEALGIPAIDKDEEQLVVWADLLALQIEAAHMMPSRGRGWSGDLPKFELGFMGLFDKVEHWRTAHDNFLRRFDELATQLHIKTSRQS